MLPSACGLGQHFQALGHSFSPYGPPSRQITYIDEGVKQLSNVLVNNNCQLSSLNLEENNITDEGVKQLSNALVNNNKLRQLHLYGNDDITNEAKKQIQQANPNCEVTFH